MIILEKYGKDLVENLRILCRNTLRIKNATPEEIAQLDREQAIAYNQRRVERGLPPIPVDH